MLIASWKAIIFDGYHVERVSDGWKVNIRPNLIPKTTKIFKLVGIIKDMKWVISKLGEVHVENCINHSISYLWNFCPVIFQVFMFEFIEKKTSNECKVIRVKVSLVYSLYTIVCIQLNNLWSTWKLYSVVYCVICYMSMGCHLDAPATSGCVFLDVLWQLHMCSHWNLLLSYLLW